MTTSMTEFPEGTRIAIPLPWKHSPSGCVEWEFVGWTTENDAGLRLPILDDGGETGAWASDYALRDQKTGEWVFPNGERCDDEGLLATFRRRQKLH